MSRSVLAIAMVLTTATLFAQPPTTQTAPQSTAPATAPANPATQLEPTLQWDFKNTTLDTILVKLSERYGFIIISGPRPAAQLTAISRNPIGPADAINLLNDLLEPLEYQAITFQTNEHTPRTVLLIVPNIKNGKFQTPVFSGIDPDKIEISGKLITQIIPLKNLNAVQMSKELSPRMSPDADVVANPVTNSLIITDTSAHIHHLVEMLAKLDQAPTSAPAINPSTSPASR